MKRFTRIALTAAIVVMVCGSVLAQQQRQRQRQGGGFGGGFGRGPIFLLSQKSVQEELKLSEEQITKVKELSDKQRESFRGLGDLSQEERRDKMQAMAKAQNKAVAEILKPKQLKRVRQISLQQPGALGNPEVAKALDISEEQREKIRSIQTKAFEELRELGRDEEARKKRQEAMKATNEKVMGVLTAEQKTKLKEMRGEPFTGKIEGFGGGRGRRDQ